MPDQKPLRILHCFRSPVGGIFRHVRDLARLHHEAGHQVGILCDSTTGGAHEDALFDSIRPYLALGLVRTPIHRSVGPADLLTLYRCMGKIKEIQPDIIHGHGAKGGALARLIGARLRASRYRVARIYTAHGGSLHFSGSSLAGRFYFRLERFFEKSTDGLVFVSEYERSAYLKKVGKPRPPSKLIYNGLAKREFEDVVVHQDAAQFLYVGMLRQLKGPDLFVDAIARVEQLVGKPVTAAIVGDGADKEKLAKLILQTGRPERVKLYPAMPIAEALQLGVTVVVPSRAESMPYVVLETLAAGRPLIATNVGGIHEIFDQHKNALVAPGDVEALAQRMALAILQPQEIVNSLPNKTELKERFSVETMADYMIDFYHECSMPTR